MGLEFLIKFGKGLSSEKMLIRLKKLFCGKLIKIKINAERKKPKREFVFKLN